MSDGEVTPEFLAVRDTLRAWVRGVLERTGWSAVEFAQRAGFDPKTVTRFLNNDKVKPFLLNLWTVHELIATSGTPLPAEILPTEPARPPYVDETTLCAALEVAEPLLARLSRDQQARVLTATYNDLLDAVAEGATLDLAMRLARRRIKAAERGKPRR